MREWIRCSERLPSDSRMVEVTVIGYDGERCVIDAYCKGSSWFEDFDEALEVQAIAWRPRPTPYDGHA